MAILYKFLYLFLQNNITLTIVKHQRAGYKEILNTCCSAWSKYLHGQNINVVQIQVFFGVVQKQAVALHRHIFGGKLHILLNGNLNSLKVLHTWGARTPISVSGN